jgi:hypothetical protein
MQDPTKREYSIVRTGPSHLHHLQAPFLHHVLTMGRHLGTPDLYLTRVFIQQLHARFSPETIARQAPEL